MDMKPKKLFRLEEKDVDIIKTQTTLVVHETKN